MNVYHRLSIRRRAVASVFNGQGTVQLALGADLAVKEAAARAAIESAKRDATIRAAFDPSRDAINPALGKDPT